MPSADRLDHTVLNVKFNLDTAATLFGKLGFTLTPRGYHSHGSMNQLMMFGTDYLELIGIPKGKTIARKDLQDAPIGINGIAFKALNVDDITQDFRVLVSMVIRQSISSSCQYQRRPEGRQISTVTVRSGIFPGGRVTIASTAPQSWSGAPNGKVTPTA